MNGVLSSFSLSIIEEYRLTGSNQRFADAFVDLCIKKQAAKRQCIICGGLAFQSNIPGKEPNVLLMADRLGGISGCMKNIRFLYRMQICHQTNQLQGTIHSSAQWGYHFHTTSVIDSNGCLFLVPWDNLRRPGIHILTEGETEFERHYNTVKNPMIICYIKYRHYNKYIHEYLVSK